MILNNKELAITLNEKYHNNPGFFEGVIDAINEFSIYDFYQLYTFREDVILFLQAYHFEGLAINEQGELIMVIFPFRQRSDILLALYAIVQYLK